MAVWVCVYQASVQHRFRALPLWGRNVRRPTEPIGSVGVQVGKRHVEISRHDQSFLHAEFLRTRLGRVEEAQLVFELRVVWVATTGRVDGDDAPLSDLRFEPPGFEPNSLPREPGAHASRSRSAQDRDTVASATAIDEDVVAKLLQRLTGELLARYACLLQAHHARLVLGQSLRYQ